MEKTYTLIVSKPGQGVKIGGECVIVGAGRHISGTGVGLAEATKWVRKSPRYRHMEEER